MSDADSAPPAGRPRSSGDVATDLRSWVLVVGMHRSGTSAVAGALGALGCLLPGQDDRVSGPGNPEHFESLRLSVFDEELLGRLGGSWEGPPDLAAHWPHSAAVLAGDRARAALLAAFPLEARSVWKDPRLCLLLPYWRRVLPGPVAAVVVWRPPLSVARSLERRDAMPLADGLALWERYNRSALAALRGLPVTVLEYDAVVADPATFADDTSSWLASLDGFPPSPIPDDPAAAAALVRRELRHYGSGTDVDGPLTSEQRRLTELLRGLDGHHRALAVTSLGLESPWTGVLLEHRRRAARQRQLLGRFVAHRDTARLEHFEARARQAETEAALAEARAELALTRSHLAGSQAALQALQASTSWRLTQPVRWAVGRLAPGPGPGAGSSTGGER